MPEMATMEIGDGAESECSMVSTQHQAQEQNFHEYNIVSTKTDAFRDIIQGMRRNEETTYRTCDYLNCIRQSNQKDSQDTSKQLSLYSRFNGNKNDPSYHCENAHEDNEHDAERMIAMRSAMALWCFCMVDHCQLDRENVAIAMNLMDRFLMQQQKENAFYTAREYQLMVLTCFYTAIKVHETIALTVEYLAQLDSASYSIEEIEAMEKNILLTLQWRVNPPTAMGFVRQCLEGFVQSQMLDESSLKLILDCVGLQVDMSVMEYDFSCVKPSQVAYCALANAFQIVEEERPLRHSKFLLSTVAHDLSVHEPRTITNCSLDTIRRWLANSIMSKSSLGGDLIVAPRPVVLRKEF